MEIIDFHVGPEIPSILAYVLQCFVQSGGNVGMNTKYVEINIPLKINSHYFFFQNYESKFLEIS